METSIGVVPVLVLGGGPNALSIVRSLSKHNSPVKVASGQGSPGLHSRFCKQGFMTPKGVRHEAYWEDLLLGNDTGLKDHLILSGSDESVEFLSKHKESLKKRFYLDDFNPEVQLNMLNKQKTLELAQSVGVPTPKFWPLNSMEDLKSIIDEVRFPIMIKPLHSHLFQHKFSSKHLLANSMNELEAHLKLVFSKQQKIMLSEVIEGPDSLAASYYSYLDTQGNSLFQFTLRVVRRYPANAGTSTYTVSHWNEELAKLGDKFFKGINYSGMGQIEFKRDMRDGQYKIIECNPRFTAFQGILNSSGLDYAYLIYCHALGKPVPADNSFKDNVGHLALFRDCLAFRQLKQRNEITFLEWVSSLGRKQSFQIFSIRDPWPAIVHNSQFLISQFKKRIWGSK